MPRPRNGAKSPLARKSARWAASSGDDVVFAEVFDPCICGAQNCPYYAIRLTAGKPRVLLSGFAVATRDADRATPLPGIVADMHDSAMIIIEDRYTYRDGKYGHGRLRACPRERPRPQAGRRRAGTVRGGGVVGALARQRLARLVRSVRLRREHRPTAHRRRRELAREGRAHAVRPERPGDPGFARRCAVPLPAGGTYRLQVDNDSETDVPYALSLAIR